MTHDRLDYISGRAIEEDMPSDKVALVAEGAADRPPGDYVITLISDDGARVWVDGEEVIDAWAPHESKVDRGRFAAAARNSKSNTTKLADLPSCALTCSAAEAA